MRENDNKTPWYHNHRIAHGEDNLILRIDQGAAKKSYASQFMQQGARGLNCLLFYTMDRARADVAPRPLFPKPGDTFDAAIAQDPELHFWLDMTRNAIADQHDSEALGNPFHHKMAFVGAKDFMGMTPGESLSPVDIISRCKSYGEMQQDVLCVEIAEYLCHKIDMRQKSFPFIQNKPQNSAGHRLYDDETLPTRPSIVSRYT